MTNARLFTPTVQNAIDQAKHAALSILGRQQLKRWVQLSLFSTDSGSSMDNPLVEMAAARASFMEQLVIEHPQLRSKYGAADQAFMVGILSLLDEIYQIPIEQIVTELNLSDEARDALVEGMVTGSVVVLLRKVRPEVLGGPSLVPAWEEALDA